MGGSAIRAGSVAAQAWLVKSVVTIVLDEAARAEALRLFFGVSTENLAIFAHAQAERTIAPLLGGPDDYSAVYIGETHVVREAPVAAVRTFLGHTQSLFVLAGESGMGKTCVMIDVARHLADAGYPVLFFRGALLQGDILDEIADEVEWAFAAQRGSIDTIRRLAQNSGDKPLIVMIDGVEDWPFPSKVQNLVSLAAHANSSNIRVIVSCKTAAWERFTHAFGSRTGIEHAVHGATQQRRFSTQIEQFSPREFHRAIEKHYDAYKIEPSGFEPAAFHEAERSPFMLRLLFQVKAAELKEEAPSHDSSSEPIAFDSSRFFETYLHLAARRTGEEEVAVSYLIATAQVLFETDQEWVAEQALRAALRLKVTDSLPHGLFQQRLLIGAGAPGARRIGFGFGLLRNYIIAFHVRRWQEMPPADFAQDFVGVTSTSLRSELLGFYYRFATDAQRRTVDANVYAHALDYLQKYAALIDEFPALRDSFEPRTRGRIGFAGELGFPARIGWFGFRAIADGEPEVLLVPVDATDDHASRLLTSGVKAPHSFGAAAFATKRSVDEIKRSEVVGQLEEMIKKGRLNESAVPDLADELIVCALTKRKSLAVFIDARTRQVRYPVDLDDVMTALRREMLVHHFRDEAVEAKRRRGEIEEHWRGRYRLV